MKNGVVTAFAVIGWLAAGLLALRFTSSSTYEKTVRDQFGSPEAVRALAALYERVEKEGGTLQPARVKLRLIPQSWMPVEFAERWRTYYDHDVNRVVAHFDDGGSLVAIEFDDSRCGCYVSRDPTRGPSSFGSLHRLATTPLFVTGRVAEDQ